MMLAAAEGHVACIDALVRCGGDVNKHAETSGVTALFLAAQQGHAHCVEALARHGADVNKRKHVRGGQARAWCCYSAVTRWSRRMAARHLSSLRKRGTSEPSTCWCATAET